MESELLKKLSTDPAAWPYYLLLAVAVIFIVKVINVGADAAAKHLSEKVKERRGLLPLARWGAQIIMIALVIYGSNAIYWSRAVYQLVPPPTKKPINTCETTVELVVESDSQTNTHFMDRGGYLAFCVNDSALLVVASTDSWGRSLAQKEYMYRGIFKMDATDSAVGKPVDMLLGTQYIQVEFSHIPKEYNLVRGKAVCVFNSEVRLELPIPPQKSDDGKVFIREIESFKKLLR